MASLHRALSLTLCLLGVALCAIALSPVAPAAPQPADAALDLRGATVQSAGVDQPQATPGLALPERVVLDGPTRHGSATVQRDVAATLDSQSAELDGAYEQALLEEQLASADGESERRAAMSRWTDRLNASLRSLDDRSRTARVRFQRGDASASAVLSTLRTVDARARQLEDLSALLQQHTEQDSATNVTARVEALQGDIVIKRGPVRQMVSEISAGDRPSARVHVSASPNGTVLSTISDGEYHREATRADLLQARGTKGVSTTEMFDITTQELYPTYDEHYDFASPARRIVLFQLYRAVADNPVLYPHGELHAYTDGVSRTAFWEHQQLNLDSDLPTADTINSAENGTSLSVDRTYPSGPARVRVTTDDRPVNGSTVRVDGVAVDQTEDGVAWVVLPEDVSTVSVGEEGRRVDTTVSW